jgi:hypothetical protein
MYEKIIFSCFSKAIRCTYARGRYDGRGVEEAVKV